MKHLLKTVAYIIAIAGYVFVIGSVVTTFVLSTVYLFVNIKHANFGDTGAFIVTFIIAFGLISAWIWACAYLEWDKENELPF